VPWQLVLADRPAVQPSGGRFAVVFFGFDGYAAATRDRFRENERFV
jgi:hypothetical protein